MKVLDLYNNEDHEKHQINHRAKIDLEALQDASLDCRVRDRSKAVLLRSEGWSTAIIAQALRLHETSIVRHIDDFVSKDKLAPENGGSQPYLKQMKWLLILC